MTFFNLLMNGKNHYVRDLKAQGISKMLHLKSWGNAWIEHLLNPETGRHRLIFTNPNSKSKSFRGFACYEHVWGLGCRFYAVYGHNNRLIFQAGRRRWDLTEGCVEVDFKTVGRGAASRVRIKHNGAVIHQASFVHPLRALTTFDPTFDGLDAEASHFFLFLSNNIAKTQWKRYVLSLSAAAT